ncbi:MAG: hypothetical protein R3302_09155, partial [Sulfurimonadaceae bacterium]|nr:hypothetical protein [Sulfurimonadaceae bacterium]
LINDNTDNYFDFGININTAEITAEIADAQETAETEITSFSDTAAYEVEPGKPLSIDFDGETSSVEISYKDMMGNKGEGALITAYDAEGNVVGTFEQDGRNGNGWETHTFSLETPFTSIQISGVDNSEFKIQGITAQVATVVEAATEVEGDTYEYVGKMRDDYTGTEGDDTLNIKGGEDGELRATADMGAGDDTVIIDDDIDKGELYTGSGDDTVSIGDDVDRGSIVDTGAGDDTVTIADDIKSGAEVNTGAGDDTVTVGDDIKGTLDFGEGFDTLVISEPEVDFGKISDNIENVEQIDLTQSGSHKIELEVSDVLDMTANAEEHTIKITGTDEDEVDLHKEDWTQTESTEEGFNTYTANDDPTVTLQIQDDINVGEF